MQIEKLAAAIQLERTTMREKRASANVSNEASIKATNTATPRKQKSTPKIQQHPSVKSKRVAAERNVTETKSTYISPREARLIARNKKRQTSSTPSTAQLPLPMTSRIKSNAKKRKHVAPSSENVETSKRPARSSSTQSYKKKKTN